MSLKLVQFGALFKEMGKEECTVRFRGWEGTPAELYDLQIMSHTTLISSPQLPVMLGLSSSLDLMRKPGYPRSHSSPEAEQRLEDTDHMREAPGRCWSDRQTWLNKSCCDNCASSGVWGEYIHIPVCLWDSICPAL